MTYKCIGCLEVLEEPVVLPSTLAKHKGKWEPKWMFCTVAGCDATIQTRKGSVFGLFKRKK